jgi:azurin
MGHQPSFDEDPNMKLSSTICLLASLVFVMPATTSAQAGAAAAKAGRTVNLTGNDTMKYDVTTIQAKPGETLHIVLKNAGSMPKIAMAHNVVILKPGTDGAAFTSAGMTNRDTEFIAPAQKANVLASTQLAGAGETVELTFKVPAKPATYPFVCTFPGHYAAGMHGTIVAK